MARRDSNPDPLDSSSGRTTTLENTATAQTPGHPAGNPYAYGTSGAGASNPANWQRAGQESQAGSPGAAAQVKEQAKGLASEAKQEVTGMAGQAKQHVQNLVGERKDLAAEQLGSFAGSLRDAAKKLDDGDGGATALGRYAQTAADQVDRVSLYLRDRDLQSFVRDAETFARRHPDVFLGGTFIAGLIFARFFKASDRRRQDDLAEDWQSVGYSERVGTYGSSPQSGYGTSYGSSYGGSYGNTYNAGTSPVSGSATSPATGSTSGSTYEGERSENNRTPGGPVPPVGG
jgi:hypothetical protein